MSRKIRYVVGFFLIALSVILVLTSRFSVNYDKIYAKFENNGELEKIYNENKRSSDYEFEKYSSYFIADINNDAIPEMVNVFSDDSVQLFAVQYKNKKFLQLENIPDVYTNIGSGTASFVQIIKCGKVFYFYNYSMDKEYDENGNVVHRKETVSIKKMTENETKDIYLEKKVDDNVEKKGKNISEASNAEIIFDSRNYI